ncbi:MAG: hypothetical protein WC856_02625 [Methylococcaceae bacterium]|jgi:hypothetical protein
MSPKEVQRFLNTFDALEPRRDLYKHQVDRDNKLIELIKEAIVIGDNKALSLDIVNYVRKSMKIAAITILKMLDEHNDSTWEFSRGKRTSKYYSLIDDGEL